MLTIYRRMFALLDRAERRQALLLLGMIVLMSLVEVAGVASILPFLAVLANPAVVETNAALSAVHAMLGFGDVNAFMLFLGGATFALVVFGQLLKAATIYAITRFSRARELGFGLRLLSGYLHQPYVWFLERHSADLGASVLSEAQRVVGGVMIPAFRLVVQAVVTGVLVAVLIVVDPAVAVAMVGIIGASYGLLFILARRYLERLGDDRFGSNAARYRAVQEGFGGIKDVKLMGLEDRYLERYRVPAARLVARESEYAVISEMPRYLLEAVVFGAMVVLLIVLVASADGRLDAVLPVVGLYAVAGMRMFPALQQIYANAASMRFYRPALEAMHNDLATFGPARRGCDAMVAPLPVRERLELRDVRFSYPTAARASLDGLDLTIPANTTVGIVGPSGAGKTTAVDVILGLLRPQHGMVAVDGEMIEDANLRAWQHSLGYVPQHIFLTDDTLAANIALGLDGDEIDMAAVERAARVAELHDFVTSELPEGYETRLGERGIRLSGGQRQRVGIARALYHDPSVLVLDEATSALDHSTERAVMDAVHNLAHAKTIIIIAHRLSTVAACDTIFVLEGGRCVRTGPSAEVLGGLAEADIGDAPKARQDR